MIDEFITLCQKIEEPVPPTDTAVEIYPMPNNFTRKFQALTFIPDQYQSTNNLDFGQMPSKERNNEKKFERKILITSNDGQSMLLSVAIVLCLAGLLYILIYFTK